MPRDERGDGRTGVPINRGPWRRLLYGPGEGRRFVQDSPVLPNVSSFYVDNPGERAELLFTPLRWKKSGELAYALGTARTIRSIDDGSLDVRFIYNQSTVAASLTFDELICWALPFTPWWKRLIAPRVDPLIRIANGPPAARRALERDLASPGQTPTNELADERLLWWIRVTSTLAQWQRDPETSVPLAPRAMLEMAATLFQRAQAIHARPQELLFSVSLNREARVSVADSVRTVKADAALRLFELECKHLHWAVLDSGIDASHPAFQDLDPEAEDDLVAPAPESRRRPTKKKKKKKKKKKTGKKLASKKTASTGGAARHRVVATYDFTRLRRLLELASSPDQADNDRLAKEFGVDVQQALDLRSSIAGGRDFDWDQLAGHLKVPDEQGDEYVQGLHPHGTHVAGILAGGPLDKKEGAAAGLDGPASPGVCPSLRLYDIRVLDRAGRGSEFDIIAALQFVRHLNAHKEKPVINGANLSLSIVHDVENYACGRTPVCDECERLVASGVVAVAAAGNRGYEDDGDNGHGDYRDISITDPGNTEAVIAVGATHRVLPHTYGVSFFSSRGPTGDGRIKPDLVAPGEKIEAPVPGNRYATKDGTSMAAPHVSGAAALLMARHRELIGQPARVKQILCDTATDLGRERYFQGHGLVDILRAIQSI